MLGSGIDHVAHGLIFVVLVREHDVVKMPRDMNMTQEQIEHIANVHNEIASHVPELLPYIIGEGYLIQARALGTQVRFLTDKKRAYQLKDLAKRKARSHGWQLRDTGDHNVFYHEGADAIHIIDCHLSIKS